MFHSFLKSNGGYVWLSGMAVGWGCECGVGDAGAQRHHGIVRIVQGHTSSAQTASTPSVTTTTSPTTASLAGATSVRAISSKAVSKAGC